MTLERTESICELRRRIDDIDSEIAELFQKIDKLETERKEALEIWMKATGVRRA